MLEEEQEKKNIFIGKIEQYSQDMSELSKVMSSISVTILLHNMIVIMPVYCIYLKHQKLRFDKKKEQNSYFLAGTEPGRFMEKYSIVLPQVLGVLISP